MLRPEVSPRDKQGTAPIFIVGAPRSGTTLLSKIIGRHEDIFIAGESHFFEDIWSRQEEFGALENAHEIGRAVDRVQTLFGRYDFPETQSLVDSAIARPDLIEQVYARGGGYGVLYAALMETLASSVGKRQYCDDTPKHLYYLHDIYSLFPSAKVVGCVRDPRDFLSSYKNYWKTTEPAERSRMRDLYHPIVTGLLWRSSTNLMLKHFYECCRDRLLLVQYEELVARPKEEVARICAFLGLPYSDRLIEVETHNSSFKHAITQPGIFTSSVGRWRYSLSAEELWWSQTLAGTNMGRLGYEAEQGRPSLLALVAPILSAPFSFISALRVNTARRGPVLPYLWRRLQTLVRP